VPIANDVTTGRIQVRRDPRVVLLAPIGRIVGLRNNQVTSLLWAQVLHGKTSQTNLSWAKIDPFSRPRLRLASATRRGSLLTAYVD
jgi:hypothetical protein